MAMMLKENVPNELGNEGVSRAESLVYVDTYWFTV